MAGWLGWLGGWMAGWLDGWMAGMAGCLDGGEPRQPGGPEALYAHSRPPSPTLP